MRLYTKEGWLDTEHIEEVADRNDISFIAIIGKRQIGKTFNVLKLMIEKEKCFILLRGVMPELEMLKQNVNSPFEELTGGKDQDEEGAIKFKSESEYTAGILKTHYIEQDEDLKRADERIGMAAALSTIGRVRGLFGGKYTDVVFDEAIPESHLLKVRHGDDAFLNMYTTINGNRELEGKKALRVWILANSNNLDSDILSALNITDIVEKMTLRGEESRIIKERGIMVILPDSKQIIEKRKKGALYKAIGGNSKFSKMAYENEFAYNDYTDVASKPLQEYNAFISIQGLLTIYLHKSDKTLYVVKDSRRGCKYNYPATDYGKNKFIRDWSDIRAAFLKGRIVFQSMEVKNMLLKFMNIV